MAYDQAAADWQREAREARAETERLRARLLVAEDVCAMYGWTASSTEESDREKALYMLWSRWLAHFGTSANPRDYPHLSDAEISRLAAERDAIRDRTVRAIREVSR